MKSKRTIVRSIVVGLAFVGLLAFGAVGTASAAPIDGTWNNLGGSWGIAPSWVTSPTGLIPGGAGATVNFEGTQSASRTITLDGDRTVGIFKLGNANSSKGLTFNPGTPTTSKLILDNGSGNAEITFKNGGGNAAINIPVELKSNLLITNSDSGGNKGFWFGAGLSSTNGNLTVTNTSNNSSRTKFLSTVSDGASGNSITFLQTTGWSEFNNANTFTGSTTIQGGIIIIGNSLALQNSALGISFNGTATTGLRLATGVTTLTLGGLTGDKNFAATGGVFSTASGNYNLVTAMTLNPGTGKSHSYSGVIDNGVANMTLTKTGAGTQTLSGANSYTGATKIGDGTLKLGLASSTNNIASSVVIDIAAGAYLDTTGLSGGTLALASGQTLKGTGTVTGALTVAGGSTLSPGSSLGTLTVKDATETWAGGGKYAWQLLDLAGPAGTGWDLADITGTGNLAVTATTTSKFNIVMQTLSSIAPDVQGTPAGWNALLIHSWKIASSANAITGWDVADGLASNLFAIDSANFVGGVLPPAASFNVSKTGNDVYLNYVPEPATIFVMMAAGLPALLKRRQRRS